MLPFCYPLEDFEGTTALDDYLARVSAESSKRGRCERGDAFGLKPSTGSSSGLVFPAFKSLFQSDHLGVEIVLAAHEGVLQDENILIDSERLRGHQTVPFGPRWTGLIIDDFFALRAEHRDSLPLSSFACRALALARDAYAKHGIEGSEEKDIEAADYVKAAGAEIDSRNSTRRFGLCLVSSPFSKDLL